MLMSWVRSVFSAFARAQVWISLCSDGGVGGGSLDARVSLISVCSALLVTVPISDMDTAIRSSVRCSKAATDFWTIGL